MKGHRRLSAVEPFLHLSVVAHTTADDCDGGVCNVALGGSGGGYCRTTVVALKIDDEAVDCTFRWCMETTDEGGDRVAEGSRQQTCLSKAEAAERSLLELEIDHRLVSQVVAVAQVHHPLPKRTLVDSTFSPLIILWIC